MLDSVLLFTGIRSAGSRTGKDEFDWPPDPGIASPFKGVVVFMNTAFQVGCDTCIQGIVRTEDHIDKPAVFICHGVMVKVRESF